MNSEHRTYLPAAGVHWALPLYDPIGKLLGSDRARKIMLEQAAIRPNDRILDIGCGTGTLSVLIKQRNPGVSVRGLDPDPEALARGAKKAGRYGLSIQFDQGFSDRLPYSDASFDVVFSTLMFHHLKFEEKGATLREVLRVLAPGGRLHLLDLARPEPSQMTWLNRRLYSSEHLRDTSVAAVLKLMEDAGFAQASKAADGVLLFGSLKIAHYRAVRPDQEK